MQLAFVRVAVLATGVLALAGCPVQQKRHADLDGSCAAGAAHAYYIVGTKPFKGCVAMSGKADFYCCP